MAIAALVSVRVTCALASSKYLRECLLCRSVSASASAPMAPSSPTSTYTYIHIGVYVCAYAYRYACL